MNSNLHADRAETNRANARNSTGPITEEGKSQSRFNAFRHGLTGKTIVMPCQDREAYEAFCREIFPKMEAADRSVTVDLQVRIAEHMTSPRMQCR